MASITRYLAQALLFALFFVPVVYLTQQPRHTHLEDGKAVLKVAIRHAGSLIGECAPPAGTEARPLPGNAQLPLQCPRERSPLKLELTLDGEELYRGTVPPSGLHDDGISSFYKRFTIPAGQHHLRLSMNDDVAVQGPTWQFAGDIDVRPAQVLVATFKEGFRLQ